MKIVLVRHGETDWSLSGRHTGSTNIPLNEKGKVEANDAGIALRKLLGDDFDSVCAYSSPLVRSLDTATLVCGSAKDVAIRDELAEFNYGEYEGLSPADVREFRPGWDIWCDGCPNGETPDLVGKRVDNFIAEIQDSDSVNLVFAHGHVIRILAARAVGLNADEGRIFTLDTATISIIEDVRGIRVVKLWNLAPSLVSG